MLVFLRILTVLTIAFSRLVSVQSQNTLKTCNESMSMTFNPQELSGIWYEVARQPAPSNNMLCTQVNLTLQSNNIMDIRTTFSNTPLFPWVNETIIASVDLGQANNPYGYNFSYTLRDPLPKMTYKLLYTDYKNFSIMCGYQNLTDATTFFNILLTRMRMPGTAVLNDYESLASKNFTGFSNSSMSIITQEESCYSMFSDATRPESLIGLFWLLAIFFVNI